MQFRIADTFTSSLARLTGVEQKAVKTTAFDLQVNPAGPGLRFHRLDRAKDPNFWSVRVSRDIRLIVHRTADSLLLCYVGHHDKAYEWAERRKLETHPATGAAQLVEIRERVEEIVIPGYLERPREPSPPRAVLAHVGEEELLGFGVPAEWVSDVRRASEDELLALTDHLPAEAAEAVLELATGGTPRRYAPATGSDSFDHPDARRRFRTVTDVEELARALEYPWEKWTVFLHPAQRELVERPFTGPARIAGSAGTGKTIVALHRAVHLARTHSDARVLLTTFSETLATALREKLGRLVGTQPRLRERIDVEPLDAVARRLVGSLIGGVTMAEPGTVRELLRCAARDEPEMKFGESFLTAEWEQVVDAWQLRSWEEYRDVARLGRKTRLSEKQRRGLWTIFERVRRELDARGLCTEPELLRRLTDHLQATGHLPYDYVVVDEAQDIGVAHLRLLAALGAGRDDSLFFAGDLGQRIFQTPFSWKSLGVDVRGRSGVLRVNYRTSHQIRSRADRLLGAQASDVDGYVEDRSATVSVFNGPPPVISVLASELEEFRSVGSWLEERIREGIRPEEIAILVRSDEQRVRASAAVQAAGLEPTELGESLRTPRGRVAIGGMHLAKGLEFRAVAVMACDDEVLPLQERIESVTDDADLEKVYETERHLLYVACTRARDHLLITGVEPASEFLEDLGGPGRRLSSARPQGAKTARRTMR